MGDFIVGAFAVIGVLTVAGFALVAVVIVLKDRSRKRRDEQAQPGRWEK